MPDLSEQTFTISGPYEGLGKVNVLKVTDCFNSATGATATYSGSGEFEPLIVTSIHSGSAPNIAAFPQPSLAAKMAKKVGLTPIGSDLADWMTNG